MILGVQIASWRLKLNCIVLGWGSDKEIKIEKR